MEDKKRQCAGGEKIGNVFFRCKKLISESNQSGYCRRCSSGRQGRRPKACAPVVWPFDINQDKARTWNS